MPTIPLPRKFFALYRNTSNAGVTNPDPAGYFSCRMNVARFLDIDKVPDFALYKLKKVSEQPRDLTIVDSQSNVLVVSSENSDGRGEPGKYFFRKQRTGKSIRIKTGIVNANKNSKTIGFLFPSWADIKTIADALGTIIPTTKISLTPSETEIYPYFSLEGGGTYSIEAKASATSSDDALVAIDDATSADLAAKAEAKQLKTAGSSN